MVFRQHQSLGSNNLTRRKFMHFASGLSAYALSVSGASANEPFSRKIIRFNLASRQAIQIIKALCSGLDWQLHRWNPVVVFQLGLSMCNGKLLTT
jgi:hypothetical protein